jgi:hypothetical protein
MREMSRQRSRNAADHGIKWGRINFFCALEVEWEEEMYGIFENTAREI